MRILKFNERFNSKLILKYYAFDVDDNLLYMPTVIHLEKKDGDLWIPVDVSTQEFASIRGNSDYRACVDRNDRRYSFSEFRDFGPRGDMAFVEDVISSISNGKFGPVWEDFIECLTSGCLFAIITARGHEDNTIRKSIEWIINNYLNEDQLYDMYNNLIKYSYIFGDKDKHYSKILKGKPSENKLFKIYLDNCDFVGISAPSRGGDASNPEKAKEDALMEFHKKINRFANNIGAYAKIGFSDDDLRNVKKIENLIDNIKKEQFPNIIKYVVIGTKDPLNITRKYRIIETSHQTPGLESSVLKFTEFGNMTGHLYPQGPLDRQDDFSNQFNRQVKYLQKTSNDILKKSSKKKRRCKRR